MKSTTRCPFSCVISVVVKLGDHSLFPYGIIQLCCQMKRKGCRSTHEGEAEEPWMIECVWSVGATGACATLTDEDRGTLRWRF